MKVTIAIGHGGPDKLDTAESFLQAAGGCSLTLGADGCGVVVTADVDDSTRVEMIRRGCSKNMFSCIIR